MRFNRKLALCAAAAAVCLGGSKVKAKTYDWGGMAFDSDSSTAAAGTTTYAVGYADASAIGSPATFMGQSIDNTSVLARLAYLGDANLDGKVNALDFNALATNFGKTPGSDAWTQGDFNYDGNVTTSDFTALAGNFNATPLSSPALGTLVPEPASIILFNFMFLRRASARRNRWWKKGVR